MAHWKVNYKPYYKAAGMFAGALSFSVLFTSTISNKSYPCKPGTYTATVPALVIWGPHGRGGTTYGYVKPEFEEVRSAFHENFSRNLEMGSQLVIYYKGELVVDLYGFSSRQDYYDMNTLQSIDGCGMNMESLCIAVLADRGLLSYDDPVSKYWPEFGQHSKDKVTIADVLRHEAGVPFFTDPNAMDDATKDKHLTEKDVRDVVPLENAIADSGKYDLDGTRFYHGVTRGWILSAIVRRVDPKHRSLTEFMREEICEPLELNIHCGISADKQKDLTFANLSSVSEVFKCLFMVLPMAVGFGDVGVNGVLKNYGTNPTFLQRTVAAVDFLSQGLTWYNSPRAREVEFPSGNMQANARSIARANTVFTNDGVVDGKRVLSSDTVKKALSDPTTVYDGFLKLNTALTKGGFCVMKDTRGSTVSKDFAETFDGYVGWGGHGGSLSLFNPEKQISFAYTMNAKSVNWIGGERGERIMKALNLCIEDIEEDDDLEDVY